MRILKISLSWIAALLGVAGAGADVLHISPALSGLMLAAANLLAMEGYAAATITPALARAFGIVSSIAVLLVGAHLAGQIGGGPASHVVLFKVIGTIGLFFGLAGKNPVTSAPGPQRVAPGPYSGT